VAGYLLAVAFVNSLHDLFRRTRRTCTIPSCDHRKHKHNCAKLYMPAYQLIATNLQSAILFLIPLAVCRLLLCITALHALTKGLDFAMLLNPSCEHGSMEKHQVQQSG
jgi:hypothetical protein